MSLLGKASGKDLRMNKKSKLKILHVGNHTRPCVGGVEEVIWSLAHEQAAQGHAVEIMVFDACTRGNEKLPAREKAGNVLVHRVPAAGYSFYPTPPEKILVEKAREMDIVHIHGVGSWLDTLTRNTEKFSAKLILTTHGGFFHTPQRRLLKWVYAHFFLPRAWNKLDGVTFVSSSDAEKFSFMQNNTVPREIIANGISEDYFSLSLQKKDANMLVFVGRLSKNKRVDNLIRAFAVFAQHPSAAGVELHIIGKDWEGIQSELMEVAQHEGVASRVFFHGEVSESEKFEWMERAGYMVSASEYEGFGIGIIEGMAAGCIPVLNTIPPFQEFSSGGRGVIVPFENAHTAGEKMAHYWNATREKSLSIRNDCRAYARTFSWKIIAQKYEEFYSRILHAKRMETESS